MDEKLLILKKWILEELQHLTDITLIWDDESCGKEDALEKCLQKVNDLLEEENKVKLLD
jgi:hypothetical protein